MVFKAEELPPMYQKILQKITEQGGTITTEQFRKMFLGSPTHTIRLTDDDIEDIMLWLKHNGYIQVKRIPNKAWNIQINEHIS